MLDLYCERLTSGLWAEPVNAVTNIGFVIAAGFVWRFAVRQQANYPIIATMSALILAIGVGSFLFHTWATAWAQWLDLIPIFAFKLSYLGLYLDKIVKANRMIIVILLLVFLISSVYAGQFPELINGSLTYAPGLLAVFALTLYHYSNRKVGRGLILAASALFSLSIALRSMDNAVCSRFAPGTHFLWHITNALVIYLAMKALILNLPTRSGQA